MPPEFKADITRESPDTLRRRFDELMEHYIAKGIAEDLLKKDILLTPSCGTGSLSIETSELVFSLLERLR